MKKPLTIENGCAIIMQAKWHLWDNCPYRSAISGWPTGISEA